MLVAEAVGEAAILAPAISVLLLYHVHIAEGIEPQRRSNLTVVDLPQPSPTEQCDFVFIGLVQLNQFGFDEVAFATKLIMPVPSDEIRRHEAFVVNSFVRAPVLLEFLLALDPVIECEAMLQHEADLNTLGFAVRWKWMLDELTQAAWRVNAAHP